MALRPALGSVLRCSAWHEAGAVSMNQSERGALTLSVFLGEGAPPVSSWKASPSPGFCSTALGTPACLADGRAREGNPETDPVGGSCEVAPCSSGRCA